MTPKNDKGKTRYRLAHNRMRNALEKISRLLAKGTPTEEERISLEKAQSVVNDKDLAAFINSKRAEYHGRAKVRKKCRRAGYKNGCGKEKEKKESSFK